MCSSECATHVVWFICMDSGMGNMKSKSMNELAAELKELVRGGFLCLVLSPSKCNTSSAKGVAVG